MYYLTTDWPEHDCKTFDSVGAAYPIIRELQYIEADFELYRIEQTYSKLIFDEHGIERGHHFALTDLIMDGWKLEPLMT